MAGNSKSAVNKTKTIVQNCKETADGNCGIWTAHWGWWSFVPLVKGKVSTLKAAELPGLYYWVLKKKKKKHERKY